MSLTLPARTGGVKPMERESAGIPGLNDLGTIEAGKIADLVAVRGDPIANIRLMEEMAFVMKDGVVVRR